MTEAKAPAEGEMVEKVARAISRASSADLHGGRPEDYVADDWEEYLPEARAAIASLPTSSILVEALAAIRDTCNHGVNSPDEALAHVDELARQALLSIGNYILATRCSASPACLARPLAVASPMRS